MQTLLAAYFLAFAMVFWPPTDKHRYREMKAITTDLATHHAGPLEGLYLTNIVAMESGFERYGRDGKLGEVGAFQIRPFPGTTRAQLAEWRDHGADEALRRFRAQGIYGYMGCTPGTGAKLVAGATCEEMAENRIGKAQLYYWAFPPPSEDATDRDLEARR
jgi:hypothetical protein